MSRPAADFELERVLSTWYPLETAIPLILDSPHSGTHYPDDFGYVVPFDQIRMGEDAFIDEIFADARSYGAWLMAAEFPRSYIDPNRDVSELDPEMLDGEWPEPLTGGDKVALGMGLIWKVGRPGLPLYDRKLTVQEARNRIDGYWRPYHGQLQHLIDSAYQKWGKVWHINCHSMPSPEMCAELDLPLVPGAQFVLGDRDGTTASREFLDVIMKSLEAQGYSVAINAPFKGVELVRRHGQPSAGRESIQIEIDRSLYMDEHKIEKNAGFDGVRQVMSQVISDVAKYVRAGIQK